MRNAKLLLALALAGGIGGILGIGVFTFGYAEGWSYLSNDPRACTNCHIMDPQFDAWQKSSHHTVAVCNDCHLPHAFVPKWIAKARNGFNHGWAFTFQDFHEPIQITKPNAEILQHACIDCHGALVHPLLESAAAAEDVVQCVHCHLDVGHGARAGLGR
ncbi:MAG: cytochrome c nitrite reductase small subunit [Myxococcaceae bacterium]